MPRLPPLLLHLVSHFPRPVIAAMAGPSVAAVHLLPTALMLPSRLTMTRCSAVERVPPPLGTTGPFRIRNNSFFILNPSAGRGPVPIGPIITHHAVAVLVARTGFAISVAAVTSVWITPPRTVGPSDNTRRIGVE